MYFMHGLIMKILAAFGRNVSCQRVRLHSTYVKHVRYLLELKENDEACRRALTQGTFYLFHRLSPFLQKVGNKYSAPQIYGTDLDRLLLKMGFEGEKMIEDAVLIGCSDNCIAEFALDMGSLEKSIVETELKGRFTDLRKAFFLLGGTDAPLLSRAQSLLRWHDTHQFCSKTGQPTRKNMAGSKRFCSANGLLYYPQMSPVIITLVSNEDHCLLARQDSFPKGMYTAIAGFCDIGETLEETIQREVAEEVGLEVQSVKYSGSQHWPFPNSSLMFACQAKVHPHAQLSVNKLELESARWFNVAEVEEALSRDHTPSRRDDDSTPLWVPPKWAIAHQLIQEWVQEQRARTGRSAERF
ncbi:NAD(P)H pyrophosphatase NUDT13, mitochondrial isoform X1 [Pleurodeles waltl]|uniref:NAD(P)H pyrophosphatase NUDT13, mitochondrial isoform X1 n=1 Tax=Pleurodeles waltl TaxID=8319 RepID=UPI0037095270